MWNKDLHVSRAAFQSVLWKGRNKITIAGRRVRNFTPLLLFIDQGQTPLLQLLKVSFRCEITDKFKLGVSGEGIRDQRVTYIEAEQPKILSKNLEIPVLLSEQRLESASTIPS